MSGDSKLAALARERKLLLGVVHLEPLPGSPRHAGNGLDAIAERARADAAALLEAGFDGWILENFGDAPFWKGPVPAHVIAAMTRIARELPRGSLAGANVLRNDASGALAVAAACGLDFIRVNVHTGAMVTDQGVIEGDAARTMRERSLLARGVAVLADVAVKHAYPLGAGFDLAAAAKDATFRGLADGLIVTGRATGAAASADDLKTVVAAAPGVPVLAGSGVTRDSVRGVLRVAGGVIVGTALKRSGRVEDAVDRDAARAFAAEARRA